MVDSLKLPPGAVLRPKPPTAPKIKLPPGATLRQKAPVLPSLTQSAAPEALEAPLQQSSPYDGVLPKAAPRPFRGADPRLAEQMRNRVRRLNPGEFIQNDDGTKSTELTITVTHPKLNGGRPTNIPSIWSIGGKPTRLDGPDMEDRSVEYALQSGEEWDSYDSISEAEAAARARSDRGGRFQDGGLSPEQVTDEALGIAPPRVQQRVGRGPQPPVRLGPRITQRSGGGSRQFLDDTTIGEDVESLAKGAPRGATDFVAGTLQWMQVHDAAAARRFLEQMDRFEAGELRGIEPYASDITEENVRDDRAWQVLKDTTPEQRASLRENLQGRTIAEAGPLYKAGENISTAVKEEFPLTQRQERSTAYQVGSGFGQIGVMIPLAAAGGLGVFTATAAGMANSGMESYKDALAHGADVDTAYQAFTRGSLVGATEIVPIAHLLSRIDKASGGRLRGAIMQGAVQAFEEGGQEGVQAFLGNVIARDLYDHERAYLQDVARSAGIGALVGGPVGAGGGALASPQERQGAAPGAERREPFIEPDVARGGRGAAPGPDLGGSADRGGPDGQAPGGRPSGAAPGPAGTGDPVGDFLGKQRARAEQQGGGDPAAGGNPPARQQGEVRPDNAGQGQDARAGPQSPVGAPGAASAAPAPTAAPQPSPQQAPTGDGTRANPAKVETPEDQAAAGAQAATSPLNTRPEPTEAQKEAGNYPKAHFKVQPDPNGPVFDITIENPKGSKRSGTDPGGKPWEVEMPSDYGYFKRSQGKDGEQIDVYLGPKGGDREGRIFIIDQLDPATGDFDEHKVMFGYADTFQAIDTYEKAFQGGGGIGRIGAINEITPAELKTWLNAGRQKKAYGDITGTSTAIKEQRAAAATTPAAKPAPGPAAPNQTQPPAPAQEAAPQEAPPADGSEGYRRAWVRHEAAFRAFQKAQDAYRARTIGDDEYIAARDRYQEANKEFDAAFKAESEGRPVPDPVASAPRPAAAPAKPVKEPASRTPEQIAALRAAAKKYLDEGGEQKITAMRKALGISAPQANKLLRDWKKSQPKKPRPPRQPKKLLEMIAAKGGLKDTGGELKAGDHGRAFVPGFGPLVRPGGMEWDTLAEFIFQFPEYKHLVQMDSDPDKYDSDKAMALVFDLLEGKEPVARGEEGAAYDAAQEKQAEAATAQLDDVKSIMRERFDRAGAYVTAGELDVWAKEYLTQGPSPQTLEDWIDAKVEELANNFAGEYGGEDAQAAPTDRADDQPAGQDQPAPAAAPSPPAASEAPRQSPAGNQAEAGAKVERDGSGWKVTSPTGTVYRGDQGKPFKSEAAARAFADKRWPPEAPGPKVVDYVPFSRSSPPKGESNAAADDSAVKDRGGNPVITSLEAARKEVAAGTLKIDPERSGQCYRFAGREVISHGGHYILGTVENAEGKRIWHALVIRDGLLFEPTYNRWFDPKVYSDAVGGLAIMHWMTPRQVMEFGQKSGQYPDPENQGLPPADQVKLPKGLEAIDFTSPNMPDPAGFQVLTDQVRREVGKRPKHEKIKASADWVVRNGERSGHEYGVAITAGGRVVWAGTAGSPTGLPFTPEFERELHRLGANINLIHNHPNRGGPLSPQDMKVSLYRGADWIIALAKDGRYSAARLSDAFMDATSHMTLAQRESVAMWAINNASAAATVQHRKHFDAGLLGEGQHEPPESAWRALHEAGVFDYRSDHPVKDFMYPVIDLIRDQIKERLQQHGIRIKAANRVHRPAESVRVAAGLAEVSGRAGTAPAADAVPGAGAKEDAQLRLLEGEGRYSDAQADVVPRPGLEAPKTEKTKQGDQFIMPGAEQSAVQKQKADEAAGRVKMTSKKPQKETVGGLFDTIEKQEEALKDSKDKDDQFVMFSITERRKFGRARNLVQRAQQERQSRNSSNLVHRLSLELRKEAQEREVERSGMRGAASVSPDMERELNEISRFINMIGEDLFSAIAVSIRKGEDGQLGQYDALKGVVTIFRNAIEEGQLSRTAIHELWHTLARYVPIELRDAIHQEFIRARNRFFRRYPFFEELLKAEGGWITGEEAIADFWRRHPEARGHEFVIEGMLERDGEQVPAIGARFTRDSYRYVNLDEWFAETMTDQTFSAQELQDDALRNIFTAFRLIYAEMVYFLKRLFRRGAGQRIFRGFTRGEFDTNMAQYGDAYHAMDYRGTTNLTMWALGPRAMGTNRGQPNLPGIIATASATNRLLDDLQDTSRWAKARKFARDQRKYWQDYLNPWRRTQAELERDTAAPTPDSQDVYGKAETFAGRVEERMVQLARQVLTPLAKAIANSGMELSFIERYLVARHAEERNEWIAAINPSYPDGGSGMTTQDARDFLASIDVNQQDHLNRIAGFVDRLRRIDLEQRVNNGLMSAQEVTDLMQRWPHYVPLQGYGDPDFEHPGEVERPKRGQGFSLKGREFFSAYGRKDTPIEVLGHMVAQTQEAIIRGEKNQVARAAARLVAQNPNPDFWKLHPSRMVRKLNKDTGLVEENWTNRPKPAEEEAHWIYYKDGGVTHGIWLADPDMARAFKGLSTDSVNRFVRGLMLLAGFLRNMYINYNVDFAATNWIRDMQDAQAQSFIHKVPHIRKKMLAYWPRALHAALVGGGGRTRAEGSLGAGSWLDTYREMSAAGGKVALFTLDDFESARTKLEKAIKHQKRSTAGKLAYGIIPATFNMVDRLNHALESAIRLAAYRACREAGMTPHQAAHVSKNITINFNRRGEVGPQLSAIYLFANASIQGTYNKIKLMAKRPKTAAAIMGGLVAGGAAQQLFGTLLSPPDDDERPRYLNTPEYIYARNIVIPLPGEKTSAFTVPLAYGLNVPWNLGRLGMAVAMGQMTPGEATAQLARVASQAFVPVDVEGGPIAAGVPTILRPPYEIERNKDFTGSPIYREPFSDQEKSLPPSHLARPSTEPVWRDVAEGINAATGGDDLEPGWLSLQPEAWRHMLRAYGGSVVDVPSRILGFNEKKRLGIETSWGDIPIIRKFVRGPSDQVIQDRFYDTLSHLEDVSEDYKRLRKENDPRLDDFEETHQADLDMAGIFKNTNEFLSDRRKEIRGITADKSLTEEQKKVKRSKVYDEMSRVVIDTMRDYERKIAAPEREQRAWFKLPNMRGGQQ